MSEYFERRLRARAAVELADRQIDRACRDAGMTFDELVQAPDEDATETVYLHVSTVQLARLLNGGAS